MTPNKPEDVFRAEKERALTVRDSQHARLLAEAKAAFDKLMAEGQAARKSGRPRKHPLPPLKTSSSMRTPVKPASLPPAPTPTPAAAPTAAARVAAPVPMKTAPPVAKTVKPPVRAAKRAAPAKKVVKSGVKSAAKSKPKAKRSTKR